MSHFAEVINGKVVRVIVATQEYIDSGKVGDPQNWVQTSYNTREGVHTKGGTPLRKNFAGIGYTYDEIRDAFIPPKKFNSWVLNEQKGVYEAPKPIPESGKLFLWDEETQEWIEA